MMTFKMIYDERNRKNLDKLADNTKAQAYKWYEYIISKKVQVLIYETIRTKEVQAENVKKGASKTMRSYHIVGQALDFVFVDGNGKALWSLNSYLAKMDIINYAKILGFTWGADWDNDGNWRDETFLDSPHIQYNYRGYGTDTFGKSVGSVQSVNKVTNSSDSKVKEIQMTLNNRYNLGLLADGYYGDKTRVGLLIGLKKEFNTFYSREMGRVINSIDGSFGKELEALLSKVVLSEKSKNNEKVVYIVQASLYLNGHKEVGVIDGKWGANTTKALNNYRKSKGFKEDGLIGGTTWKALLG